MITWKRYRTDCRWHASITSVSLSIRSLRSFLWVFFKLMISILESNFDRLSYTLVYYHNKRFMIFKSRQMLKNYLANDSALLQSVHSEFITCSRIHKFSVQYLWILWSNCFKFIFWVQLTHPFDSQSDEEPY